MNRRRAAAQTVVGDGDRYDPAVALERRGGVMQRGPVVYNGDLGAAPPLAV